RGDSQDRFDAALARLPIGSWWWLFIDADRQSAGPMAFDEDNEPGYAAALTRGLLFIRTTLNTPLDYDYYLRLHEIAVTHVRNKQSNGELRQGVSDHGNPLSPFATQYGVKESPAFTEEGLRELQEERVACAGGTKKEVLQTMNCVWYAKMKRV